MTNRICIFVADSNGGYPVPASKGGAVSTLVELLLAGNNKKHLCDMTIVTYYDRNAFEMSKKYASIRFEWIRIPRIVRLADKLIFCILSKCTKIKASSFKSILALLLFTMKSSLLIRKNRYDTVVLEHNIPMVWMLIWSGYKGKYYHHLHNLPRTNAKCRNGLHKCDGFVCISQFMVENIRRKDCPIGPVDTSKIRLLYNCIDTKLFKPIDNYYQMYDKQDFGIHPNSKVVIFAGRITWEKGVDKLLESLNYINHPDVYLLIVGASINESNNDPYSNQLKRISNKNKDKIRFTGYIDHSELPYLYNMADIAVLPSMWEEPAGLTMLEAMACGTPVITTRSGGIPEYVGDSAIILNRDDDLPQNIALNIDILLNNRELYMSYSRNGVKRIREMFDSVNYIDKFMEVIS